MTLAAMLSLVLAVAVPALAQVSQGEAERSTTGTVTLNFTADNTGNSSSQCVTPLQFGNTGAQQNAQGALQYGSQGGGLSGFGGFFGGSFGGGSELTGPTFTFEPTLSGQCTPQVEQSSAASSSQYATPGSQTPVAPVSSPSPY
jgi:hypothetical protein